jgi:hypothetical protein
VAETQESRSLETVEQPGFTLRGVEVAGFEVMVGEVAEAEVAAAVKSLVVLGVGVPVSRIVEAVAEADAARTFPTLEQNPPSAERAE